VKTRANFTHGDVRIEILEDFHIVSMNL
jgi:hypothetical protein